MRYKESKEGEELNRKKMEKREMRIMTQKRMTVTLMKRRSKS